VVYLPSVLLKHISGFITFSFTDFVFLFTEENVKKESIDLKKAANVTPLVSKTNFPKGTIKYIEL